MTDTTPPITCTHISVDGWPPDLQLGIDTLDGTMILILCDRCAAMIRGIILQNMLNDALKAMPRATFARGR